MLAAEKDHAKVVKCLISAGADLTIIDMVCDYLKCHSINLATKYQTNRTNSNVDWSQRWYHLNERII